MSEVQLLKHIAIQYPFNKIVIYNHDSPHSIGMISPLTHTWLDFLHKTIPWDKRILDFLCFQYFYNAQTDFII